MLVIDIINNLAIILSCTYLIPIALNTVHKSVVILCCLILVFNGAGLAQQTQAFPDSIILQKRAYDRELLEKAKNELVELLSDYRQIYKVASALRKDSVLLSQIPSIFPLKQDDYNSFTLSSPFGLRWHPILNHVKFHNGIDIPENKGVPVYATASGVVEFSGFTDNHLGVFVKVRHKYGFETFYGHLSAYSVLQGERVTQGQMIGRVGSTGLSTGNHLHYIIKKNGLEVNPYQYCYLRLNLFKEEIVDKGAIRDGQNK